MTAAFRKDGSGAVVNASRSVLGAWKKSPDPDEWQLAAREAVLAMNGDMREALSAAGKWGL